MTTIDLDHLDALCAAAGPGPWETAYGEDPSDNGIYTDGGCLVAYVHHHACIRTNIATGQEFSHADAAFIAAARTALPQLVAEVRRLREAVRELLSTYERCDYHGGCRNSLPGSPRVALWHNYPASRMWCDECADHSDEYGCYPVTGADALRRLSELV